jgi:hypothetical protein
MRSCKQVVCYAKKLVGAELSWTMQESLTSYIEIFNKFAISPTSDICIFSYHVETPPSHRVIDYVDVKHDHGAFNYCKLISHFVWSGLTFNVRAGIFFVTNDSWHMPVKHKNLTTVRLPVSDTAPMFERVKAMTAYVYSSAFQRDTVFLDSDAFPNREIKPVFAQKFDVGVTYRTTPGFMPINEGVIYCSVQDRDSVRRFFSAYLATYENLIADQEIQKYYGDIKRWRGGQLALSALASPNECMAEMSHFERAGVRIGLLPCTNFNHTVTQPIPRRGWRLNDKYVLHLKGKNKMFIESLIAYQMHRTYNYGSSFAQDTLTAN